MNPRLRIRKFFTPILVAAQLQNSPGISAELLAGVDATSRVESNSIFTLGLYAAGEYDSTLAKLGGGRAGWDPRDSLIYGLVRSLRVCDLGGMSVIFDGRKSNLSVNALAHNGPPSDWFTPKLTLSNGYVVVAGFDRSSRVTRSLGQRASAIKVQTVAAVFSKSKKTALFVERSGALSASNEVPIILNIAPGDEYQKILQSQFYGEIENFESLTLEATSDLARRVCDRVGKLRRD